MRRKAIILILLFLFCPKAYASELDFVFSEIMYDAQGTDSGHEWIEIYNSGTEEVVSTSTWRFFDGANHSLNLYQGTSTIRGGEYFVIADNAEIFLEDYPEYTGTLFDSVMSLPNFSSSVAFSFDQGQTYSINLFYDASWGGESGYSLQLNTSTGQWQASQNIGGSPGAENIFEEQEEIPPEEEDNINWTSIIISEFIPNPVGSDDEEWIELYNRGEEDIDLAGFALQDNSSRKFELDSDSNIDLFMPSHSYKILYKNITGISLNNSGGDSVKLYDPEANLLEQINYTDAPEGKSYARQDNVFFWTKTPSPGSANQIAVNQNPIAQIVIENGDFIASESISFSGKTSSDPEGDELDFLWDFGDGKTSSKETVKHKFDNIGSYTIILEVRDSEGAIGRTELPINITSKIAEIDQKSSTEEILEIKPIDFGEDDLFISEFIPNPVGSDDNEWIEIYNASSRDIDLLAWQVDDQDGGSKPYQFSSSTVIKADSFLLLKREETKITLNNSSDSVRLLTPSKEVWQEVSYEKISEGKSYAWDFVNSEWFESDPQPNQKNVFEKQKVEELILSTAEVKDFSKNDFVIVQGVALTEADSDVKNFYLSAYRAGEIDYENILEIYSYYKNFPDIKIGQVITISGQISKTGYLPRLKISSAEDIILNDVYIDLPEPEIVEIENIDEDLLGTYISIRGVVTKKSGKNIYLATNQEEDYTLRAYTDFSTKELTIKKGSEMIIKGVLTETDSGFKILPQTLADLWVSREVLAEKIDSIENSESLDLSTSTNLVVENNSRSKTKQFLLFLLAGVGVILVILSIKKLIKIRNKG